MTGLSEVPGSRAFYEGICGVVSQEGRWYVRSSIGVDGKMTDHLTEITEELAARHTVSPCDEAVSDELEGLVVGDLRRSYPGQVDRSQAIVFMMGGGSYTIPARQEVAPGVVLMRFD